MAKKKQSKAKSANKDQPKTNRQRKPTPKKNALQSSIFIPGVFIITCFLFAFLAVGIGRGHLQVPRKLITAFPILKSLNRFSDPDDQYAREVKSTSDVPISEVDFIPPPCENDLWLSQNGSVPGYHVLCVTPHPTNTTARIVTYFPNGATTGSKSFNLSSGTSMSKLRRKLEKRLKIRRTDKIRSSIPNFRDKFLPWRMFTSSRLNVQKIDNHFYGTIVIFEGGQWIWPTIRIGFMRNVSVDNRILEMETLSTHPAVFLVKDFMTSDECDAIINVAAPTMAPSTITHMHNTEGDATQWRTSETTWLRARTQLEKDLQQRTAELTGIPQSHQETAQVLRYNKGQQYDSHWDYFDPSLYKGTPTENSIRGKTNRLATVFWYLSDVLVGGWTYFPRFGMRPDPPSYKLKKMSDCEDGGLLIQPVKGATAVFYSMLPNGEVDPLSLHGACPVGEGQVKWAANKWVWNRPITHG